MEVEAKDKFSLWHRALSADERLRRAALRRNLTLHSPLDSNDSDVAFMGLLQVHDCDSGKALPGFGTICQNLSFVVVQLNSTFFIKRLIQAFSYSRACGQDVEETPNLEILIGVNLALSLAIVALKLKFGVVSPPLALASSPTMAADSGNGRGDEKRHVVTHAITSTEQDAIPGRHTLGRRGRGSRYVDSSILLSVYLALTPVLITLTEPYANDTVDTLVWLFFALHLFSHDYFPADPGIAKDVSPGVRL